MLILITDWLLTLISIINCTSKVFYKIKFILQKELTGYEPTVDYDVLMVSIMLIGVPILKLYLKNIILFLRIKHLKIFVLMGTRKKNTEE